MDVKNKITEVSTKVCLGKLLILSTTYYYYKNKITEVSNGKTS